MKTNNSRKGSVIQGVLAVIALVLLAGGMYWSATVKTYDCCDGEQYATSTSPMTDWKTHTSTKYGYSFKYPDKLSINATEEKVNLKHEIAFENSDGGCDMVGNAILSPTLNDFDISMAVLDGEVKPSYIDGTYSAGSLSGIWAYMGAEGCGETIYYFPIAGNRTLVVTKQELQILSPVVSAEVRNKVLAVPGVISYEESNQILKEILSTLEFTPTPDPLQYETPTSEIRRIKVTSPKSGEVYRSGQKVVVL